MKTTYKSGDKVMKKLLGALLIAALLASNSAIAIPVPTLTISAGLLTTIVDDGSLNDSDPTSGTVTFDGSVGSWNMKATGIASPPLDSFNPAWPMINPNPGMPIFWDFNVVANYSGDSLSYTDNQFSIKLTVDNLMPGLYYFLSLGSWDMTSIATSNWSTSWIWYADDTPFQIWPIGPNDLGKKGLYASSAWLDADSPFSVAQEFKTAAISSDSTIAFNFRIWGFNTSSEMPEPSSILLILAAGLGMFGVMQSRNSGRLMAG